MTGSPIKVLVEDLEVLCLIGVSDEELQTDRLVRIGLELELASVAATKSDSIDDTVDYAGLAAAAAETARSRAHRTLERLAARVAERCLEQAPAGSAIRVRVAKPDPPMPERVREVAVVLRREA